MKKYIAKRKLKPCVTIAIDKDSPIVKSAEEKRKQAAEKLRRLANVNFDNSSVNIEVGYTSKTATSLLTVNK